MADDQRKADDASTLTAERELAERRYRDALEAVDRSVPSLVPPAVPPAVGPAAPPRSLIGKALSYGLRYIGRFFARVRGRRDAMIGRLAWSALSKSDQIHALARFHHGIIQYMQRIYPLIDTKHRHQMMVDSGLAASVDEIIAVHALRWEATVARERRLAASIDEIRTGIAAVQQTGATLKRELERLLAAGPPAPLLDAASPAAGRDRRAGAAVRSAAEPDAVNAYKYVGFEDLFRGSESEIGERLAGYVPLFEHVRDVLDLGCGRGEFLAAMREKGLGARGVDINHEMVELCRARGLEADEADALSFLEQQADGSLGGLFAAQVVEHLQPGYLMRLLDVAFHALRPGSPLVLETLNPACWSAFFDSYLRDVTHVWPLHPDTLRHLVTAAGFQRVEVRYMAPYPPDHKLRPLPVGREVRLAPAEAALVETFNANVERLNDQLFGYRDYAVIARRP